MALDGTISGNWIINDRRTVGIATTGNLPVQRSPSVTFTDGVGAGQANTEYAFTRTLTAGADNLDLNAALLDLYGTSVAAVRIKAIYLKNLSAANNMVFGAHATLAWATFLNATGTITLKPGAWIIAATPDAAGWAVTAATADMLKVAGTGTDQYEVAFIGGLT